MAEEVDLRRAAILLAAERACQVRGYVLRCGDRCGAVMTATRRDTILSRPTKNLALRAYEAGWQVVPDGLDVYVLCPACYRARAGAVVGAAPGDGEGVG